MPDPTLRDQLAEALRAAPVRGTVMRMTVLTELYGPVDALADAVLAVVQPLLDAKDAEVERLTKLVAAHERVEQRIIREQMADDGQKPRARRQPIPKET